MWTTLLFMVTFLATCSTLNWTSSLEDNDSIITCVDDNVSLPWSFAVESGDVIMDIGWYHKPADQPETTFAGYLSHHMFSSRPETEFLPPAGLILRHATVNDSGTYSVRVNSYDGSGYVEVHNRTAEVIVAVPHVTSDGSLHVHQRAGAVKGSSNGEWNIELECGQFTDLGFPPVSVTWTTPSGSTLESSGYDEGFFSLALPNPVETGNYSCQLPPDSPSAVCLNSNETLLVKEDTVYVDGDDVRWTLMEARQRELTEHLVEENVLIHNLTSQVEQLTSENNNLTEELHHLQGENDNLTEHVNHLEKLAYQSCAAWRYFDSDSGIRPIYLNASESIQVYCDQTTDPGGWTVFQRRKDGSIDFYRSWDDYEQGFGNLEGEFWLGLQNIRILTSARKQELRVDLVDFRGLKKYAIYRGFWIGDRADKYRLHYDSFAGGNAGDSLTHEKGHQFTTRDADHDGRLFGNCAITYHGAWWYDDCHSSNLNGDYKHNSSAPHQDGLVWGTFNGDSTYSLKFTEMKIRPMEISEIN